MREIDFLSKDGKTLKMHMWEDVASPKGVVQIMHGMAEHSLRYDEFARFLNGQGFFVYASDHRAHGKNCQHVDRLGCVDGDIFEQTLADQQAITDLILSKHDLPLYIFAHSFGSFIAQKYIQIYGGKIKGIILSGSSRVKKPLLLFGKTLAKNRMKKHGEDYISPMILQSGLKSYGRRFGGGNNWLTSVQSEVEKYEADPLCGTDFPCGFYYYFFHGLLGLYTKEGMEAIPQKLPILILSGSQDPVGDFGKGVKRLYKTYQKQGLDVTLKLFEGGRHEMINEEERQEVFETAANFFANCP